MSEHTTWRPLDERPGVDPEYRRQVEERAAEVAADYPPLTQEQRARLSVLLCPAGTGGTP